MTNKFKIGDVVWFTKSMRMCKVIRVWQDGYTVERVDSYKHLFAPEDSLELVDSNDATDEQQAQFDAVIDHFEN